MEVRVNENIRERTAGVDANSFQKDINLEQTGGMTDTDRTVSTRMGN